MDNLKDLLARMDDLHKQAAQKSRELADIKLRTLGLTRLIREAQEAQLNKEKGS